MILLKIIWQELAIITTNYRS